MNLHSLMVSVIVLFWAASGAQAATCESLQVLTLPNVTITSAELVPAGAFTPPNAQPGAAPTAAAFSESVPFCRVAATLRPSGDSDIKIEVWMPQSNWNGKFQGVGNGGFAGVVTYTSGRDGIERGMAEAVKRGYAVASTDTGHVGATAAPFFRHPEKLADFGWRAVYEMTVSAKAIVSAFYGTGPRLSYWNGCSTGGRQGLMEAQRFPSDYDGIAAGAPANPQTRLSSWNVYVSGRRRSPMQRAPFRHQSFR